MQKKFLFQQTLGEEIYEVIEENKIRSLQFGSSEKQSTMFIDDPCRLVLPYTQTMMISLLFKRSINKVLVLGLGGGSIPKYLHKHLPECQIDVVEKSELVIELAYKYFEFPDHKNISVFIGDGINFMSKGTGASYDLIFVDLFDRHGIAKSIRSYSFIFKCCQKLQQKGVAIFNIWTEPKTLFKNLYELINICFDEKVFRLPTSRGKNQILFAQNTQDDPMNSCKLRNIFKKIKGKRGKFEWLEIEKIILTNRHSGFLEE